MNNSEKIYASQLPSKVYISGVQDPNKVVKIQHGNKTEYFFRTDDIKHIWQKFATQLSEYRMERDHDGESIIKKLNELINILKQSTTYQFYKPTSLFPTKSTIEDDDSLIWMITENPYQKIMFKKNPEYILQILDIWHEYFWIKRPVITDTHQEQQWIEKANTTPINPHITYACEFVKKTMNILELKPDYFEDHNGIIRFSQSGKKLAWVPNIIDHIQEAFEVSQLLEK